MVNGIDIFRKHFSDFKDQYTIIGGFACDLLMTDAGILDAEHIIPLKMKAWLDLKDKKAQGIHVNSRDIRKHRLDVFRLFPLIRADIKISVPASVGEDIKNFIVQIRETDIRLTDIGITRSKDSILDIYSNMYITD